MTLISTKKTLKILFFLCIASALTACASAGRSTDFKIHEINSLSSLDNKTGAFQGMEFLANPLPGKVKNRVNIFYVHGIGWTENPKGDPLANDFLAGLAKAYDKSLEDNLITSSCGSEVKGREGDARSHIYITPPNPVTYDTALPGSRLTIDSLICMDTTVLEVDDGLEFAVYRVFWDDLFWSALQYPHVGQDDDTGSSKAIAGLRRRYNRKLKDELVNYGFSDAVMYLGPAGAELRRAVQGAMCSAALDASGHSFEQQGERLNYNDVCALASWKPLEINQFAFVTESLGSKITFDVMQESMSDGKDNAIDAMISGSEFYMLANQLPLLSLNNLSLQNRGEITSFSPEDQPKIIALSELNDFLTYELIPFYEHLWDLTVRAPQQITTEFGTRFATAPDAGSQAARDEIIKAIGFDIVDIRLEFANKLVPMLDSLVDPLQAHGGHAAEPDIMLLLLCGANRGRLNKEYCLATELDAARKDD